MPSKIDDDPKFHDDPKMSSTNNIPDSKGNTYSMFFVDMGCHLMWDDSVLGVFSTELAGYGL